MAIDVGLATLPNDQKKSNYLLPPSLFSRTRISDHPSLIVTSYLGTRFCVWNKIDAWCMMIDGTSSIFFCETILWLTSSRVYSIVSYLSSNFRLKQSRHTANHRPFLLQLLPPKKHTHIYMQVLPLYVSQLSWLVLRMAKVQYYYS